MSDRAHNLTATAILIIGVTTMVVPVAFIALILALVFHSTFLLPLGTLVAAIAIRTFVRWLNRRDDPRQAKRPDDAR